MIPSCMVLTWRQMSRGWLVMSGEGLLRPCSAAVVKDGISVKSSDARGAAGSFLVGSWTSSTSDARKGSCAEQGSQRD